MKIGKIVRNGFIGAVPVACGILGTVCLVPTAFEIGFSIPRLAVFCVYAALMLSFWMTMEKYGFGFGALLLASVILMTVFRFRQVGEGAVTIAYQILSMLPEEAGAFFDIQTVEKYAVVVTDPEAATTLLLMLAATVCGVFLSYSLLRSKQAILSLLMPLPMTLLGFLYTDQPPAMWTVMLLVVYWGCALLGNGLRKGESPKKELFLAIAAPLLLVFALLLFAFFPRKDFQPITAEKRQQFFSSVFNGVEDKLMEWFGNTSPDEIDLDRIGDCENRPDAVFSVRATADGDYHLRVHSYGQYADNRWHEADPYDGDWRSMEALGARQPGTDTRLYVKDAFSDERVVPYAFAADGTETGETYIRAKGETEYLWRFRRGYRLEPKTVSGAELAYYRFAVEQYTMPDGSEKQALSAFAEAAGIRIRNTEDPYEAYETACRVAEYVRTGRVYTQTPAPAPKGQDFILYFLNESREGYCIHFASATTATLQALGIPARYTSGYYVPYVTDAYSEVTAGMKHAWTEIYLCGVGWVPIESTPSFPDNPPFDATDPTANDPGQTTPVPAPLPTPVPTPVSIPAFETPTPGNSGSEPTPQSTAAPKTPAPNGEGPDADGSRTEPREKHRALWLLLLIPGVPLVWAGAALLVLYRRRARFADPNVKRAIPEMAHYLRRLERFGVPKDPDAAHWAIEAVFSDHPMKEERKELMRRVRAAQETITKGSGFRRFMFRWLLFVL